MENGNKKSFIAVFALLATALAVVSFTVRPNAEFNEDLGRHIALGKIILETKSVPYTNLFTYTHGNYPFINHHWLSEVLYYGLFSQFGPHGLTFLTFILLFSAFFIACLLALKKGNILTALFSILLLLPLIGDRIKVRPESFGFFIFVIFIYILFFNEKKNYIWLIPPLIVLWTNLHITFAFGGIIVGAYIIWKIALGELKKNPFRLFIFSFLSFVAIFLNPNGWKGALAPLSIFENYGYRIVENQSVFFLIPRVFQWIYPYHIGMVVLFFALFTWWIVSSIRKKSVDMKIAILSSISLLFGIGGIVMVKNIPFFVLSAIPTCAILLSQLDFPRIIKTRLSKSTKIFISLVCIAGVLVFPAYFLKTGKISTETYESGKDAVDFFLRNKIPGNIFNNFDIGGYLDYRLYPAYKTFVDNRPEAFPKEFFDEYIAIQEDKKIRDEAFKKYGIESVIFAHRDLTPWGQTFLSGITNDPEWKAVYFDGYAVIFVKKVFPLNTVPLAISR